MSASQATMIQAAMIWCPFDDPAEAMRVAETMISEELVGCANILPPMTSIFSWEGRLDKATEVAVLFKTNDRLLDAAIARIEALHSYDTPAIMAWPAERASAATREWLAGIGTGV